MKNYEEGLEIGKLQILKSLEAFASRLFKTGTTGLEPATPGSTVRYSNQLSYVPKILKDHILLPIYDRKENINFCDSKNLWALQDLNLRHLPCKGSALPLS